MLDINKNYMDDLDIFEIKIGDINGLSFRVGQKLPILGEANKVTCIRRVYVDGNKEYHIFGKTESTPERLLKVVDGLPVYYTVS